MMNLSLFDAAWSMGFREMYGAVAIGHFLLGFSLLLACVYPATPLGERVNRLLPLAGAAIAFFALGCAMLYLYIYATFSAPALGSKPAPLAALVIAIPPVLGAFSVALQVFLLLRRRARYRRATAGS